MTLSTVPVGNERHVPGETGTWVFLFGDMLVFGVFFATFLHQRGLEPDVFAESRTHLNAGIGLANTLVLLTSSLAVVVGMIGLRSDTPRLATWAFRAAMGLGLGFVGLKAVEYTIEARGGHGPGSNSFFLFYFILTGLHLFHVTIGIGVLTFLQAQPRRLRDGGQLSSQRLAVIEGGACFWHLVDLLWLVLFALLYLVS